MSFETEQSNSEAQEAAISEAEASTPSAVAAPQDAQTQTACAHAQCDDEAVPAQADENSLSEVAADVSDENAQHTFPNPNNPYAESIPKGPRPKKKVQLDKKTVWDFCKMFALLVVMAFLRAVISFVFIVPNGFAPGGIGGISSIIYYAVYHYGDPHLADTVFEPGLTTFVMNIPIIIISFFVLNKRFAFNTLVVISCYSGFMNLFNHVHFPQYYAAGDAGVQLIAAIVGGACTGFCLGIMLRYNMSMGGTDIIGKIIHKHNPYAGAQWWILMCDCVVALCSGVIGILDVVRVPEIASNATSALTAVLSPIFFSFLSLITCSIVADIMQSGLLSSLVFNIITDKPDEIANAISTRLHRGVTVSKATGYYTGTEHEVLVCVVAKRQINVVKDIVHGIDPTAFTYITKAQEVAGKGFRSGS